MPTCKFLCWITELVCVSTFFRWCQQSVTPQSKSALVGNLPATLQFKTLCVFTAYCYKFFLTPLCFFHRMWKMWWLHWLYFRNWSLPPAGRDQKILHHRHHHHLLYLSLSSDLKIMLKLGTLSFSITAVLLLYCYILNHYDLCS